MVCSLMITEIFLKPRVTLGSIKMKRKNFSEHSIISHKNDRLKFNTIIKFQSIAIACEILLDPIKKFITIGHFCLYRIKSINTIEAKVP